MHTVALRLTEHQMPIILSLKRGENEEEGVTFSLSVEKKMRTIVEVLKTELELDPEPFTSLLAPE